MDRNIRYSHWVHGVLNELHPGVAFLPGTGMNLHHFWVCDAGRDEEEAAFLVGHLTHNQLLQGDNSSSLVLLMRKGETQNEEGGVKGNKHTEREREMESGKERRREKQRKKKSVISFSCYIPILDFPPWGHFTINTLFLQKLGQMKHVFFAKFNTVGTNLK